jgi:hypothetical protein
MLPLLLPAWPALPENRAANIGLRASGMLTADSAGNQPGILPEEHKQVTRILGIRSGSRPRLGYADNACGV